MLGRVKARLRLFGLDPPCARQPPRAGRVKAGAKRSLRKQVALTRPSTVARPPPSAPYRTAYRFAPAAK